MFIWFLFINLLSTPVNFRSDIFTCLSNYSYKYCFAAFNWKILVCSDRNLSGLYSVSGWLQSKICGIIHTAFVSEVFPLVGRRQGWLCKTQLLLHLIFKGKKITDVCPLHLKKRSCCCYSQDGVVIISSTLQSCLQDKKV